MCDTFAQDTPCRCKVKQACPCGQRVEECLPTVATEHSFKGNLQNTFLILMHIIIRLISYIYIHIYHISNLEVDPIFFVKCKCHVVIGDIMMQ